MVVSLTLSYLAVEPNIKKMLNILENYELFVN